MNVNIQERFRKEKGIKSHTYKSGINYAINHA